MTQLKDGSFCVFMPQLVSKVENLIFFFGKRVKLMVRMMFFWVSMEIWAVTSCND
jgi:hypothetical protein